MQTHTPLIQNDEIDLYEIWTIIVRRKLTILAVTALATITAIIYTWSATPIYSGTVLVESGEIVYSNENTKANGSSTILNLESNNTLTINNLASTTLSYLDNINALKEIVAQISGLKTEVVNGTPHMLRITAEGPDKSKLTAQLDDAVQFILQRHMEKAKFYQDDHTKIKMTQVIGKITISDSQIKPKRGPIITVSFIIGLFLGFFIAFAAEFIQRGRRSRG